MASQLRKYGPDHPWTQFKMECANEIGRNAVYEGKERRVQGRLAQPRERRTGRAYRRPNGQENDRAGRATVFQQVGSSRSVGAGTYPPLFVADVPYSFLYTRILNTSFCPNLFLIYSILTRSYLFQTQPFKRGPDVVGDHEHQERALGSFKLHFKKIIVGLPDIGSRNRLQSLRRCGGCFSRFARCRR